jgi:ElaB/YqjD/DUF883 family membrane-anchored ribosome-binding protein
MDPQTRQPNTQYTEDKNAVQKVGEKVTQAADDARAKTTEVIDTAKMKAGDAIDSAKQVTANASDKATDVMSTAGDKMTTLAQTVREKAPAEGRAGEVAYTAAETLERGGRYLQEADPQMVRLDLERVIRQHPIESMLVGLGIGYLLARTMRR